MIRTSGDRLWRSYVKRRDTRLRNQLVERYWPIVKAIAGPFAARLPKHFDRDDLLSAGAFGLVKAIEHFDPARGVKFETFCRKWVSGAMQDEMRRQDSIPRDARQRARKLRRTVDDLRAEAGVEPCDREVADAMRMSLREVHDTQRDLRFTAQIPLELPRNDAATEDGAIDPIDLRPEPADELSLRELLDLVADHLSSRERTIVRGVYLEERSLKRIGSDLRLTESRVSKMHTAMLSRLKRRLYAEAAP